MLESSEQRLKILPAMSCLRKPALALLLLALLAGTAVAQTGKRAASKTKKPAAVQMQSEPDQPPTPPPTLEQAPPTPPEVTYRNGQLSIVARNSTMADVMNAVRAQTGATIETPPNAGSERVMSRLGPAPPQEVLAALLNGSKFDFVILGTATGGLQRVILTQRTGGADAPAPAVVGRGARRPVPVVEEEEPEFEEPLDESREIPEDVPPIPVQNPALAPNLPPGAIQPGQQQPGQQTTQPQPVPGQPQVKTPEQLLEDLRRLQQQQQQEQQQPAPQPE